MLAVSASGEWWRMVWGNKCMVSVSLACRASHNHVSTTSMCGCAVGDSLLRFHVAPQGRLHGCGFLIPARSFSSLVTKWDFTGHSHLCFLLGLHRCLLGGMTPGGCKFPTARHTARFPHSSVPRLLASLIYLRSQGFASP